MIKFPLSIEKTILGCSQESITQIIDANGKHVSLTELVDLCNAGHTKRQASRLEYPKILEDV